MVPPCVDEVGCRRLTQTISIPILRRHSIGPAAAVQRLLARGNRQLARSARLLNHCATDVMSHGDRHPEERRMHPSCHAWAAGRHRCAAIVTAALATLVVLAGWQRALAQAPDAPQV